MESNTWEKKRKYESNELATPSENNAEPCVFLKSELFDELFIQILLNAKEDIIK